MSLFSLLFPNSQAARDSRRRFIEQYEFSRGLRVKFSAQHPQLSRQDCESVFMALRDYFWICLEAQPKMASMPSQVVDDAWHQFILFTRDYEEFCQGAFGKFLHHTPAQAMSSPTIAQQGLKLTWQLACRRAGLNPRAPQYLPPLFAIDAVLGIVGGFVYQLDCMKNNATSGNTGFCATHIACGSTGCGGATHSGHDGGDGHGDGGGSDGGGSSCGGGCGGD